MTPESPFDYSRIPRRVDRNGKFEVRKPKGRNNEELRVGQAHGTECEVDVIWAAMQTIFCL